MSQSPKVAFLQQFVTEKTLVLTDEDLEFWGGQKVRLNKAVEDADTVILAERLQKVNDPIQTLKEAPARVVVTVPNEYAWPDNFNPGKNPSHKRIYDADLLAEHLEAAGYTYVLGLIEASGWSWLTAQGARKA